MGTTDTQATEIQLCGHSYCENLRREKITTDDSRKWCHMGHGKPITLSPDQYGTLMLALSSSASHAYACGHVSTSLSQWELLRTVETALGLASNAEETAKLIETLSD